MSKKKHEPARKAGSRKRGPGRPSNASKAASTMAHTRWGTKPVKTAAARTRAPAAIRETAQEAAERLAEPMDMKGVVALLSSRTAVQPAPVIETQPVQPAAVEAPATLEERVIYGLATLGTAAVLVGAYVVLWGVLAPMYPGAGGPLRALVPLAVELVAGLALHRLISAKRTGLALAAAAVVAGCAWTEIDAAQSAPAVAKRERMAAVLQHPAQAADVKSQGAASAEVGRQGNLQLAKNQGAALEIQKQRETDAKERQTKLEANAAESPAGEGRMAWELAILGAIGSSCFLPLLEGFLRACRRRK